MKKLLTLIILFLTTHFITTAQEKDWTIRQLTKLIDSIVVNNMEKYRVPGVGYAVVKGSKVIHIGSQGLGNIENNEKIGPDTKFMFGSIAKLFTTIAVLQLYEDGRIELDTDINRYLKTFQLPFTVTLKQLLTHTAGFEERVFERVKLSADKFLPLEVYLKGHLPMQIFSEGKFPAYSNHGMALAGLVVQEVSGIRYEDFIQQRIFIPLQMQNSSFYLDEKSKDKLASSYKLNGDAMKSTQLEYVQTIPASMLISTTADMTKFIAFLLNGNGGKILKPQTLKLMKQTQYSPHPKLWGRGYGFFERQFNGIRMLEHGGSRNGFYSLLSLVPKDSIGVIVTFNGGKSGFREKVVFDFLEKIYPKTNYSKNFSDDKTDISEYTGTYISNRRIESDFGKLLTQLSFVGKIKVKATNEQTLNLFGYSYRLETKDQFAISNDSTLCFPVAFGRNKENKVNTLFLPGRSDSYQKIAWYESGLIGIITFSTAIVLFLTLTAFGIKDRINGQMKIKLKESTGILFNYTFYYSAINLTFLALLIAVLLIVGESLQYELPIILYLIFSLPLVGLLVFPLMIYFLTKTWNRYTKKIKLFYCLFILLSVIYSWQLYFWNFLGFNF